MFLSNKRLNSKYSKRCECKGNELGLVGKPSKIVCDEVLAVTPRAYYNDDALAVGKLAELFGGSLATDIASKSHL